MKNGVLKSLSIPVVTLLIVFASSVVCTNAQTTQAVYAQIPFDFVVGGKTLSAGKYGISSVTQDRSALLVRSLKTKHTAIRLTDQIRGRANNNARLVFHRYGQTYFLAEVWQGAASTGRVLRVSKAERELQRERALIGQNSYETVELIASVR